MIFKTFENDIDKISAKWGIFGKSFNDIGTAIGNKISTINKNFQATDDLIGSIKNSGDSVWKTLYPKKEDIESLMIDVDEIIPEIDDKFDFDYWINDLNKIDKEVQVGTKSWQDYSNSLNENEKWIAKWGQETQGSIRTQKDLIQANQNARQAAIDHNNALKQQTLGAKAARVAMGLLSTAMNVLASVIIAKVIQGFVDMANAEKEAREEIRSQAQEAKQLTDELSELRNQYVTLSKEVETDSSKKEQLTSVTEALLEKLGYEKSAIEGLIDEYDNLDNAINNVSLSALEEAENTLKVDYGNAKKELAKERSFLDNILNWNTKGRSNADLYSFNVQQAGDGKTNNTNITKALFESGIFSKQTSFGLDSGRIVLNGSMYSVEEMIQNYNDISDALDLLNSKFKTDELSNDNVYKTLQTKQVELKGLIDEYNSSITDLNTNLSQQIIIKSLQGNSLPKTKEDFDKLQKSIVDSAIANGEFIGTEEEIENAIISVLKTMPEFVGFFKITQTETTETTNDFETLKASVDKLKETLDDTFSNQSTIQSAFDKIQEGTSLTADEVRELVELCPSLADEFEKTADGWTIGTDKLISANGHMVQSTRDNIHEQLGLLKTQVSNFEKEYQSLIDSGDYSKGREFYFANIEQIEEAEETITALELTLSMFGLTTQDTVDKLSDLKTKYDEVSDTTSNLVNKAKSLSDAFAEQNENGSLSTETVLSLIENGYAAALMYDAETGAIRLNAQAYLDLANAEIEAQIAELTLAKNDAAKTALDEQRNVVSNLGWSYLDTAQAALEMAKSQEIISNANADVSNYDAQIKILEEYKKNLGDITMGTYGGSGSSSDPIKAAFDEQMRDTEHAYAKGLISQEEYLNKLEEENEEHYKNSAEHYDDYLANIEKIYNGRKDIFKSTVDEQIKALDEQLEKGFISPAQYQSEMTKLMEQSYGMGSKYYGTEFATENYNEMSDMIEDKDVDVYESKLEELKKANDGSIEAERQFIEKWKSLNKTMFEDTDPKKYKENLEEIAEYEDDWLVRRAENEKTYWENLRQEVEDYYDNEIQKLQDILDEEEKINKQEELRNNLIKARQKLEEAKKNRNQLVFANGSFEYVVDQEAVESAAEEVSDAEQALKEFEVEQKIAELEEEQNKKLGEIDLVLESIDGYLKNLNGETDPTSSDSEVISNAGATDEANKAQDAYDSLGKDDKPDTSTEVKTDTVVVEQTGQPTSDNTGIQGTKQLYTIDEAAKILADRLGVSIDSDAWKNFATSVVSNGNPQSSPLSGIQNQNVYNNSTVDNSIRIDTINNNVTVAEGTTKQQVQSMLDGFASEIVDSLKSLRTKTT